MEKDIQGTLKVVSTTSDRLGQLSVEYGQLIFVRDTKELYFDHQQGRISYSNQIIILETEEQRVNMRFPVNGFYFVKETGIIWRYENTWISITNPPSERIEFLPKNLFPQIGKEDVLYIDGIKIYRWLQSEYVEMGVPIWETFS